MIFELPVPLRIPRGPHSLGLALLLLVPAARGQEGGTSWRRERRLSRRERIDQRRQAQREQRQERRQGLGNLLQGIDEVVSESTRLASSWEGGEGSDAPVVDFELDLGFGPDDEDDPDVPPAPLPPEPPPRTGGWLWLLLLPLMGLAGAGGSWWWWRRQRDRRRRAREAASGVGPPESRSSVGSPAPGPSSPGDPLPSSGPPESPPPAGSPEPPSQVAPLAGASPAPPDPSATVVTRGGAPGPSTNVGSGGPARDASRTVVTAEPGAGSPGPGAGAPPGGELPSWLEAVLLSSLGSRYQRFALLGSGGMGTVVRAWDARLLRDVAIKVPPPHLAGHPQFRQRFLREAQALARLGHPNVASVYDIPDVAEGEVPVMILEFLEGTDLAEILERRGPPPFKQAATWMLQAAAGLQHAHEKDILHRDIKPANLMVQSDGVLRILDFGLAAIGDQEGLTATGMFMGSIPFMPPEQLRGEKVSEVADQYALGATAYQVFTGQFPFGPEDSERTRVPSILEREPAFPPRVDEVVRKALQPRPRDRFASVAEFRHCLHRTADQALRQAAARRGG